MTCFKPLDAWQTDQGEVVFYEHGHIARSLQLACGRCIGCRLTRARSWAVRCMHEAQMHDQSSFVTLTYNEKSLVSPSLQYRDFQLFMKRLRRQVGPVRFFACGEYGEELRPHFHALLFGLGFPDRKRLKKNLYRSALLEKVWPHGYSSVGSVTYQSAAYVARYSCSKVTGPDAVDHYKRTDLVTGEVLDVVPEFGRMSLRPAIGYTWFQKYWPEIARARDGVVVGGKRLPVPRYYDKLLEVTAPELCDVRDFDRYVRSREFQDDCTPERLAVREAVVKAKLQFNEEKRQ